MPRITVTLTLAGTETSVEVWMAPGSSVYLTLMQAKSQGLRIPEKRHVTYGRHKMPDEKEGEVAIGRARLICVTERDDTEKIVIDI
ncbi:MAG: hypothetical protein HYS26_02220 [Candidatus Kaiserbacteria bacterium]|nr:MAG: hypothetical protein HYS26_02220 [Candidatus Kaiserbacteria bacterium]